jgi:5,10-methylenetetrahydromethanopterin reductase
MRGAGKPRFDPNLAKPTNGPHPMSDLRISCCLPPSKDAPAYARLAEEIGYDGVYIYDSPALYGDVWMCLGRVAEATSRITIGTGVAVPSLRHPMVTASAIASVEELAPGRGVYAFGSGFSARFAMGQKPMGWADIRRYLVQLRGLLRGEVVEVDGAACQMIHSPGFAPKRPIDVPLIAAVSGPKGFAVAREVADGVFCDRLVEPGFERCLQFAFGTVLDPGEDHTSARVKAAAGPIYATTFHGPYEREPTSVDARPGGAEWRARLERERPAGERHLALHEGHLVDISGRDRILVEAAGPAILKTGWTGNDGEIRQRLAQAQAQGVTEVVLAMAGPDIPREIRAFLRAAKG